MLIQHTTKYFLQYSRSCVNRFFYITTEAARSRIALIGLTLVEVRIASSRVKLNNLSTHLFLFAEFANATMEGGHVFFLQTWFNAQR